MAQGFFSRLTETEEILKQQIADGNSDEYKLSIETLSSLKVFVASCIWNDTDKTHVLIRNIYRRAVDAAKTAGVSANTVRSARSQASKKLFGIFGDDVFEGIIGSDIKICNRTLALISAVNNGFEHVENYIPESILQRLEGMSLNSDKVFKLNELSEEFNFFKNYNTISMQKNFEKLDKDKLVFTFKILKSELLDSKNNMSVNVQKLRALSKIM
jgi:hypothetical protein